MGNPAKLLPDFQGRQVLDLGCGYGWHAIYAVEKGAQRVIATDISAKMLEQAQNINRHPASITGGKRLRIPASLPIPSISFSAP